MLISKQWLRDYVFLPDSLDPAELALTLKLTTVEVEGITTQGKYLDHVVVGLVKKVEKHPQADRLNVCQVNIGNEDVQVVCGGSNVVEGMNVALAKVGAQVLWHGEGEPVVLTETNIRGIASYGMICGADEIGLGELFPKKDEKEILDLTHHKYKPGTPLKVALGLNDVIFEIDNKSMTQRPDLWGHLGLAREIAAIDRKELKKPNPPVIKAGKQEVLTVDIEVPALCPRYMAVMIDNIDVKPSPAYLQKRLQSVGIRPINNIVDITNYIMLDLGQPLHAFDADAVKNNHIIVRPAHITEIITALDKKVYELNEQMLVIANNEKALAIAGILGGEESGVATSTKRIIIESANFQAVSIRKTAQALGLRTESSTRFEKTLDPTACELALKRAVQLIREACPQIKVISNVVDHHAKTVSHKPIDISLETIAKKIGIVIEKKIIYDILTRLGFIVKEKKQTLSVTVPSWRAAKDVVAPEDVIEEIARMYGYNRIPGTLPSFPIFRAPVDPLRKLERMMRTVLSGTKHFSEVFNYSFVSSDWLKQIGMNEGKNLELANPIAKDRPCLRRTLIPGLLENVVEHSRDTDRIALFEFGRVFLGEEPGERAKPKGDQLLPRQPHLLGTVFSQKGNKTPFYVVSDAMGALLRVQNISYSFAIAKQIPSYAHTDRYAQIFAQDVMVGHIFELHPAIQEMIGMTERVAVAEIDIEKIVSLHTQVTQYTPVSSFPSVTRDIAFIVDNRVEHAHIERILFQVHPLITQVELFDVYQGKHVDSGKKSMAYRITYGSSEKTLIAAEVDDVHKKVIRELTNKAHATVRT